MLLKILIFSVLIFLFSKFTYSQVTDIDGNTYKTVIIGTQEWMGENLNVEHYRNGDTIPEAKTKEEWLKYGNEKTGCWCYYENDPINGEKYGKLYNWYAVNDYRRLAPEGWHVPNDTEWQTLVDTLGGDEVAGEKMKSISSWFENGNGTNESGFTAFPGGGRYYGLFNTIIKYGWFWSATEISSDIAWYRGLYYESSHVYRDFENEKAGLSVRCVRD